MKNETKKRQGVCRIYDDDSVEFQPYGDGQPIQKDLKKVRKSTFYETEGEKSSYVMHLKVDKNVCDPAAEMLEDFEKLLKNVDPTKKPKLRGKILMDTETCSVILNRPQKQLEVRITLGLEPDRSYKDDYYKLNFEVQKCFTINKAIIASAIK